MTIPSTIGTGGHAHDSEITDMQKAVLTLLSFLKGGTGSVGNAGDILAVTSSAPTWQAAPRAYAASESTTPNTASGVAGNNGWVDIVGASVSFTPKSASRQIRVSLRLSGYNQNAGVGPINFRVVFGATPTQAGSTKVFYFNAPVSGANATHLTQAFEWTLTAAALGSVGTAVTVKAQLQSPTGSVATYTQDNNDHTDFSVEEAG